MAADADVEAEGSEGAPGASLGEVGEGVRACCGSEGGVERMVMCRSSVDWAIAESQLKRVYCECTPSNQKL